MLLCDGFHRGATRVAFRLGAMINYEFSNLLHNEVTPSNPIKKKKKRQRRCLLNNISQVFHLSIFVVVVVLQAFFFSLKKQMTAFAAFQNDCAFPYIKHDS